MMQKAPSARRSSPNKIVFPYFHFRKVVLRATRHVPSNLPLRCLDISIAGLIHRALHRALHTSSFTYIRLYIELHIHQTLHRASHTSGFTSIFTSSFTYIRLYIELHIHQALHRALHRALHTSSLKEGSSGSLIPTSSSPLPPAESGL